MADLSDILPPKTHNMPPSDIELLEETLSIRYVHLMRDAEDKIALADKVPEQLSEQNEASFISDYISEIVILQKSLESARKEEKDPFLRQGQTVDEFFKKYKDKLESSINKVKIPLTVWLKKCAEEEKMRREAEAAKARAEAEKAIKHVVTADDAAQAIATQEAAIIANKAAAAPIISMAVSSGKYSKSTLKKEWVGTITDLQKVDLEKLRAYIKPEALQIALNAYVKMGGRSCEGCLIEETVKVGVK